MKSTCIMIVFFFVLQAHKSFKATRSKLKDEVDRIAKGRLTSASSMTSLSSASHLSDDPMLENDVDQAKQQTKLIRPKSASIQNMRKRNAKKVIKKFVDNDIDENDIMNKMKMAKQVINEHRECIQELLQTTTHAPNTIARIKYPTSARKSEFKATNEKIANGIDENNDGNANQYNKMPNVTTRRVVFVNLDEDS